MDKLSAPLLRSKFGEILQEDVQLAKFTSARIGGNADFLLTANSADQLEHEIRICLKNQFPFKIIGGGSNILVSDEGVREVIILNKAKDVTFNRSKNKVTVYAESGTNLGNLAKKCAQKGLGGFAWAAGIPGTVGGAIFGNAGAHGSEIADILISARLINKNGTLKEWSNQDFDYAYRSSKLKTSAETSIILSAEFEVHEQDQKLIESKMDEYKAFRRTTQPPGASMGSMFINPENDYAGRLIDAVGLKGKTIGGAQISTVHGNFIINNENATSKDVYFLLQLAKKQVKEKFDIDLHLEIELIGDWENIDSYSSKLENLNE